MIASRRWASAEPSWNQMPEPSGPRGASAALMRSSASRSGARSRPQLSGDPAHGSDGEHGGLGARRGEVGVQRVHDPAELRRRAAAGARALARGARRGGERPHGLELGAQPSSTACGAHTSSSSPSHSRAGRRRSVSGSTKRASIPSRAAMKRFSSSTSGRDTSVWLACPSSASRCTRHCTSAASAAVSATRVCASITRTSSVPKRGCSRTSHHRNVGSGKASQRSSMSMLSTYSA